MDEERRSKRSRFDQAEPRERHGGSEEAKRRSRFDRRSRSPPGKDGGVKRSRSPITRDQRSPGTDEGKKGSDSAAAAAAAAARISASIQAKRGPQPIDVPPIRSTLSPAAKSSSPPTTTPQGNVYVDDGDYVKDIEVNDLRNRYTLTKGSTQKMIKEETGADVTTRGSYLPDKSMATAANPPLYLHITSTTKEGLEKAVGKIDDMMKQELPNLVDERRFKRREPEQVERDEFGRRKWPEEKVPIGMDSLPGFNLRAQVVGPSGAYVKHIQQETRCRVQIKGRGSGFVEHATGRESEEDIFLHVAGPDPREVQRAKELCEDLLGNVKEQYEQFKQNPPQQSYAGHGQRGGYSGYGGYGGYGGQTNSPAPPGSSLSPSTAAAPGTAPGAAPGTGGQDYASQYAQYYGGQQDPYAAYGGYQNYVTMYQQWYQQQAQGGQGTPGAPGAGASPGGASGAPPPPPNEAPPPPPSGSPPGSGYNSVPPPPGM